ARGGRQCDLCAARCHPGAVPLNEALDREGRTTATAVIGRRVVVGQRRGGRDTCNRVDAIEAGVGVVRYLNDIPDQQVVRHPERQGRHARGGQGIRRRGQRYKSVGDGKRGRGRHAGNGV